MGRLGFWNRWAIVSGVAFAMAGATWLVMADRSEILAARALGYHSCLKGVGQPGSDLTEAFCWAEWMERAWLPGWDEWWPLVLVFIVLASVLYALIWFGVWIAKWVWRGRVEAVDAPAERRTS